MGKREGITRRKGFTSFFLCLNTCEVVSIVFYVIDFTYNNNMQTLSQNMAG